jgi:putative DNA-invertase from lambdoid prophage Rac
MTVYGYLRVSTKKQEIDNNKSEILLFANNKSLGNLIWIQETVSGRKDWRKRILGKQFENMKENDTIIMSEYSRIGRDFLQSIEFLAECRRKNINVFSTIGDIPIKDDASSNLLLALKAWKSQVEREDLAYRTKLGIKAHREAGSIMGRKKDIMILDKDVSNKQKIEDMINKGIKFKIIAKELNTTTTTLRKYIKKHIIKNII